MYIPSKLVWFILLSIGGTSFVIFRKINAAVSKSSTKGLITSLKKNPALARDVAESLDIPYGKIDDFSKQQFADLKSAAQAAASVADFVILHSTSIDDLQHLMIAELTFSDFDVNFSGNSSDVTKTAYHSFLLKYQPESSELSVWSDLYGDVTSKLQKEEFARHITKMKPVG